MVDLALAFQSRARTRGQPLADLGVAPGAYLLATAHRAANVDDPVRLEGLVELLEAIDEPIVLPLHPRTRDRARAAGLQARLHRAAIVASPLGYLDFAALLRQARAVLTDSGGVRIRRPTSPVSAA